MSRRLCLADCIAEQVFGTYQGNNPCLIAGCTHCCADCCGCKVRN